MTGREERKREGRSEEDYDRGEEKILKISGKGKKGDERNQNNMGRRREKRRKGKKQGKRRREEMRVQKRGREACRQGERRQEYGGHEE